MHNLAPCPFCGSTKFRFETTREHDQDLQWISHVDCCDCECSGPAAGSFYETQEEAERHSAALWNARIKIRSESTSTETTAEIIARLNRDGIVPTMSADEVLKLTRGYGDEQ
jgi:Lar family restriction alleviation protein